MKPSVYPSPITESLTVSRYIILADRSHFRIYQESALPAQQSTSIDLVTAVDFPAGHSNYTDGDSDQAGQFPRSKVAAEGGSNDERLPMKRERDARIVEDIANRIENFLSKHPDSPWVYAAGPDMHRAILQRVHSRFQRRLQSSLQKDLANMPAAELREHFPRDF